MICVSIDQFSSVTQSCPTLCDPMNRSTPGLPVHHQLLEFTHTHVHRVRDAIQPSHPLSYPSPPAPNPSCEVCRPARLLGWGLGSWHRGGCAALQYMGCLPGCFPLRSLCPRSRTKSCCGVTGSGALALLRLGSVVRRQLPGQSSLSIFTVGAKMCATLCVRTQGTLQDTSGLPLCPSCSPSNQGGLCHLCRAPGLGFPGCDSTS